MIRHVILWQLKEEFTPEQKTAIKKEIKEGLENLQGKIPGLVSIRVFTEPVGNSNADLMLDSVFDSIESFRGYIIHPAHVAVANGKVRPNVSLRVCMDTEI